ncbi:MAG: helix-turn-helix domain-containing protein [Candidatus Omnitrophota bacterium]|nr:MAG: helix-turn-helix domain-containing protein [Candidatus Omnitrophota bacterium]
MEESKQYKIEDESGDRKYFTIIPNYILNHSTDTDQALYAQMKRLAGDSGKCSAGVRYFMKQLGVGYKSVRKSLDYLIKNKWITYLGTTKIKKERGEKEVDVYQINDIWKFNVNHYDCVAKQKRSDNDCVAESNPLRSQKDAHCVAESEHKKEHRKKKQLRKNTVNLKKFNDLKTELKEQMFVPGIGHI